MAGSRKAAKSKVAAASGGDPEPRSLRHGAMRLGDLLVKMSVLTKAQRDSVLEAQRQDHKPFGVLAEEMFGVSPSAVERAWAKQYAQLACIVDPRQLPVGEEAIAAVNRRQAWQFRVLPIEFSGDELVVATTEECLPRAMRFMAWRAEMPVSFVLSEPEALGEALCKHHPMAGMRAEDVRLAAVPCST